MKNVYVIEGARTPFGAFGGSLRGTDVTQLGAIATTEALRRSKVPASEIDQTFFGNVIHSSANSPYLARHVSLKSGIPEATPALTVNRLCGSGLQAVVSAVQAISLNEASGAVAGGAENMSMSPHVVRDLRFKTFKMGVPHFEDVLSATLVDQYCGLGMGMTAENLGEKYQIGRSEQEEYALLSQSRAAQAKEKGILAKEITPVLDEKGEVLLEEDEHPKPNTNIEKLRKLRPAFKKDGSVTAATASGINDGAAAVVLGDDQLIAKHDIKPLARIVSWGIAGVDPKYMGIGPVPATKQALERANLQMEDIDIIEVNEAFAVQVLSVRKELGIELEKLNVNGGAIALGHPVGASGARLLLTLAYELQRSNKQFGLASLCIGGGQGISVIIENMN
ncbi:beta-ketoadipyl CoA thiolase [Mesobacillus campisalis]|uniref:acetyl-CoA C-acetyltransferase n=1 Tax=Mesobacillus campisalis TaxID=1408103 RepID=A0A0M2T1R0_9BACI|nr:thiolase family protein [Mesobacillus campisalis]KKK39901.1 beta-ketoadipyl CoA thiolase [Mesobacillus campisalis]